MSSLGTIMYSEVRFPSFGICIFSEKLILCASEGGCSLLAPFPRVSWLSLGGYHQKSIRRSPRKPGRGSGLLGHTDSSGIYLTPGTSIWNETEFGQLSAGAVFVCSATSTGFPGESNYQTPTRVRQGIVRAPMGVQEKFQVPGRGLPGGA